MTYPQEPGWRQSVTETSKAAALLQREKAQSMMARVEAMLADGPASCEQLHEKLSEDGERILLTSVRARVCQLHRLGRVRDSGGRALGESLRAKVVVWRLATADERTAFAAALEGDEHE